MKKNPKIAKNCRNNDVEPVANPRSLNSRGSSRGVGVRSSHPTKPKPAPMPTWGGMLSDAVVFYTVPHFMFWPGLAIFATVMAFNLFGDGLRDAFDPRSR